MPLIRKDAGTPMPAAAAADPGAELTSENSDTRFNAARQLAKDPLSVGALGRALSGEADPRVREALFTSLAHIQTPEAITVVLPYIRSNDAAVRAGAIDALNAMADAVEGSLSVLLADPDPDVRLLACDVVRRLPGPRATRYLIDLLKTETHPNVCGAAIEALSEVGDETALPVLAQCAERFSYEPFLIFSIKIASKRIAGGGRPTGPEKT